MTNDAFACGKNYVIILLRRFVICMQSQQVFCRMFIHDFGKLVIIMMTVNLFNASCSKLLLFEGFSAILV